ncbi:4-hydroxybenzoate 3-monooxygenase [Microlunatus elymi]|uniref:4-hydroxybenzoate 3-monooxygenase n=1 Tax=Microlunatus elymi TaxID=2596828 RepID=A0A516Q5N0_9ACTN|nr:4-hydroxybenzoate 3-monooxygenase [Microlunatus elymi]
MRTQVAIVGAGPAGLLLSELLQRHGVESIVVESRTREHVEARVRAGILEHSSVELLTEIGLDQNLRAHGQRHHGIYLQWPGSRIHLDFQQLIGRSVWLYGQTELTTDLGRARDAAGQQIIYQVSDTSVVDHHSDHPAVILTDADGTPRRIDAEVVVGCDGSFGPCRDAATDPTTRRYQRLLPYSWLGVLAQVAPSTDELIYSWHPRGFALHSMRSAAVSRLYLQVPNQTKIEDWSDDRIWSELATRLEAGEPGWTLHDGPILEKSVLPMHSFVMEPLRSGRLFLAGDAGHIVPPTGAKGLNLAIADVARLAPALATMIINDDHVAADAYSDQALQRVWRCTEFSVRMTQMLHIDDDRFRGRLQQAQLRWLASSTTAARELAQNYAGLPIGFTDD